MCTTITNLKPTVLAFKLSTFNQFSGQKYVSKHFKALTSAQMTGLLKSNLHISTFCREKEDSSLYLELKLAASFEMALNNFQIPLKIKRMPLNDVYFISGNKHLVMLQFDPEYDPSLDSQAMDMSMELDEPISPVKQSLTQSQMNNPFLKAVRAMNKVAEGGISESLATGNGFFPNMKKFEVLHRKLIEDFTLSGDSLFTVGQMSGAVNEIKLLNPKTNGDLKDLHGEKSM